MCKANLPLAFIVMLENISTIDEERKLYGRGDNKLNGVLLRHQRCKAWKRRDKIYAFCGLVETPSNSHRPVRIDYEDDVETVYCEVAFNILEEDQSLDLLSRPPISTKFRMMDLPSWVPDWSISAPSTLTYAWGHGPLSLAGTELAGAGQKHWFAAAGGSKYSPTVSKYALAVEGFEFDKIVATGPVFKRVQVPYNVHSFPGIVRE